MTPADTPFAPRRDTGPESVREGRDGYLFEHHFGVPEYATGQTNFTQAAIQRWVSLIETRHAWCRAHGARFLMLFAPTKHVVCASRLPPGLAIAPDRALMRLLAALAPELRACIVYPAAELIAADAREPSYFRADMHWTHEGARLAARALRAAIWPGEDPPEPDYVRQPYRRAGDLGIRLNPPRRDEAVQLLPRLDDPPRHTLLRFAYNVGQVEIFARDSAPPRTGVIFRDSFGALLLPFLAPHFRRLVAVAADGMFYDLLRAERPDVVIMQMTEHNICVAETGNPPRLHLPDDLPAEGFTGATGLALPLVVGREDAQAIIDLDYAAQRMPDWSEGPITEILLRCRVPPRPCLLELTLSGHVQPPRLPSQHVDVVVNSHLVGSFAIGAETRLLRCLLPRACLLSGRTLRVELYHPDCVAPDHNAPNRMAGDAQEREIAIRLHRLTLREAPEPRP